MKTCMGVPPWAPLPTREAPSRQRGAHGGTPVQVFIKIDAIEYHVQQAALRWFCERL
jgi:hypothetical protein